MMEWLYAIQSTKVYTWPEILVDPQCFTGISIDVLFGGGQDLHKEILVTKSSPVGITRLGSKKGQARNDSF